LSPNLAIPSTPWLPLKCFNPALYDAAESACVCNEVFELLSVTLSSSVVRVVQRTTMEVRYPRHVVVVRAQLILDGGDLWAAKRDETPRSGSGCGTDFTIEAGHAISTSKVSGTVLRGRVEAD
jgi:hypothetical protein